MATRFVQKALVYASSLPADERPYARAFVAYLTAHSIGDDEPVNASVRPSRVAVIRATIWQIAIDEGLQGES